MVKVRLQGLPGEVAEIADAMEAVGCALEHSEPYENRGSSRYVRVYLGRALPEGTVLIEGGETDDRR